MGRAKWARGSCWFVLVAAMGACGDDEGPFGGPGAGASAGDVADSDGDRISDTDENAVELTDSDGDGTADYLDLDSDNDGIDDAVEAGDDALETSPDDSDEDGTADFRDLDSDDNGILDVDEGIEDTDNDGAGDWIDSDNDGDKASDALELVGAGMDCDDDLVADEEGSVEAPADCDLDDKPNHMDLDSDGDGISDAFEGAVLDTDIDGFLDRYDLDSDNDTLPDADEAGGVPPIDTDGDTIPDFLDPDSDGDGLSDLDETALGTSPTDADSDDDGVSDLIEVAAGTNPLDEADNPQAYGDFVFLVPYQEPTDPPDDTLDFQTAVQFADIYFLFDETGSMGAEFNAMKNTTTGVPAIIDELQCVDYGTPCVIDDDCGSPDQVCFTSSCIDNPVTANGGDGCIPDMWTGTGKFNNCNTYHNEQFLQVDPTLTANEIGNTGPGSAEAVVQSPACVANPTLCGAIGCGADPSVVGPIGCPGFRPDAVRILVQISDADNQGGTCGGSVPTIADAGTHLQTADIKFVGLYGSGDDGGGTLCTTPQTCAEQIGVAADTVDTNGQPFAYAALDAAVVDATKQAILDIVRGVPLFVTIVATDVGGDAGDALQFIDFLEVNLSGTGNCTNVAPTSDQDSNTHDETFDALLGGTPVCWDVVPVPVNTTVPPTDQPQLFQALLTVTGDGSPLDERDVYFLVPPKPPEVPPPPR